MNHFIGIDSGTQSTKALVVCEDGRIVGRGQAHYGLIEGLGVGHKEQHPQTWVDAMVAAVRGALAEACIDSASVVAIGVSGQQHGFVPLDGEDRVIRPAKLWCDTATAPEAAAMIRRAGGRDACVRATGNSIPAGFTASKIEWLKQHEPENFSRLATILLPHDYLNFWLTGEKRMEFGDASGTALLDVRRREWSREAIGLLDPRIDKCLPPFVAPGEAVGTLRREAAEALGLHTGVVVSAGGGDNMMGAIGTGNVAPGVFTVSLGTSGTVYACSDKPVVDEEKGEIAAFCDSAGNWLPLLCTMNVTVATELVKKTFGFDNAELARQAASIRPGSDGLILLPYFEGERVPDVPHGTGAWLGYREATHTPAHFARAAMEGPTMGLAYGLNRMRAMGLAAGEIRLTGGGSKSPVWRSILANVFAAPVVCTTEPEGAALGAAVQARWTWERRRDTAASLQRLCATHIHLDEETRVQPDPQAVAVYREVQQVYDALSEALRPVFQRHRALLEKL